MSQEVSNNHKSFAHDSDYHIRIHFVKSVCILSYSVPHFPVFGVNMERYSISPRIQSKCGKMQARITPNMDTFHAVNT